MAQIAISSSPVPLSLQVGDSLRLSDEELFELCARNPELRIERTAGGDLIVMTPAGGATDYRNTEIIAALVAWAKGDGTGVAFGSSGGFLLPDGAMRSPDAAWVPRSRLASLSDEAREKFLPRCPDFVVELRCPSDRITDVQAKMEEYRDNGARLGWLIDPQERRIHVYRPARPVDELENPSRISGDPELPGFVLDLAPIWQGW